MNLVLIHFFLKEKYCYFKDGSRLITVLPSTETKINRIDTDYMLILLLIYTHNKWVYEQGILLCVYAYVLMHIFDLCE